MIINFEQKTHTFWHSDCKARYSPPMKKVSTRSTTDQPNKLETLIKCDACRKQGVYPRGRSGPIDVEEHLEDIRVAHLQKSNKTKAELVEEISRLKLEISEIKLQFSQSTARHDNDLKAAMDQVDGRIADYNLLVEEVNNRREAAEQAIEMLNLYAPKWLRIELKTTGIKVI